MSKVEIDGKTYCVETLIYTVKRLTKEVKASAKYHRLVLDKIRAEIEQEADYQDAYVNADIAKGMYLALEIFDKYKGGDNK